MHEMIKKALELGLSKGKIAEILGVSYVMVWKYTNQKIQSQPNVGKVRKLADYINDHCAAVSKALATKAINEDDTCKK